MEGYANSSVNATSFWNGKNVSYYFDNCAQFILHRKLNDSKHKLLFAGDCSCGVGGCGDSGGCDSY